MGVATVERGETVSRRIKGLVVTFDRDLHDEDAAVIMAAFRAFRCVASVQPSSAEHDDVMNRERVRTELRAKLFEVLK